MLLDEGPWTGIDGTTITYRREKIHEATPTILGKPIKRGHSGTDESVVGFFTAARNRHNGTEVEGLIFDKTAQVDVAAGGLSLSMEANVDTKLLDKKETAERIAYTAGALVENPACKTCGRVESVARIRLSERKNKIMEEIRKMSSTEGNNPSNEEVLNWLSKELQNANVSEEAAKKIVDVLKESIKTPPPPPPSAPAPVKPVKQEKVAPAQPALSREDLEAAMRRVFGEELQKPTRAAFLRWLRKQFKEQGFETADVGKILAVIKATIKSPYPYPFPQPKKEMSEADIINLEDIWDKTVEDQENLINDLSSKVETKETEVTDLKNKLKELEDAEKARKEAEITNLVNSIKEIDESFESEKFLEKVECLDARKEILTNYFDTVKRLQPAIKLAGVTDTGTGEQKVTKAISDLFGDDEELMGLFKKEGE